MNFAERIPTGERAKEPKKRKIRIEGGGEISVSPAEDEAHKKLEARQSLQREEAHEAKEESAVGRTLDELSDEERELLEEIVPSEESRANLSPENIEFLLRTKKEEKEAA